MDGIVHSQADVNVGLVVQMKKARRPSEPRGKPLCSLGVRVTSGLKVSPGLPLSSTPLHAAL